MLGIGSDGAQGLGDSTEEQAVDELLVLIGDSGNVAGQRKDHVKVLCVEEFGATILQPLRAGERLAAGAMSVAAAVERDATVAAVIALLNMAAECGGPAQFDRRHDAALGDRQRRVMLRTIGFAVAPLVCAPSNSRTGSSRAWATASHSGPSVLCPAQRE